MRRRGWALVILLTLLSGVNLRAHNLGESYLYLQIYSDRITGRFEVSLVDLNAALKRKGTADEITAANLDQHIAFLKDYYVRHVTIRHGATPLTIRLLPHGVLDVNGGFVLLPFELLGLDRMPERLVFDYRVLFTEEPGHRGFLLVEHNWATGTFANESGISLVFSPSTTVQEFDVTSTGRLRGFLAVVRLGTEHIWMGFDHVMFLIALLLPAVLVRERGKWRGSASFGPALINVVKIVTAFTVAHSVTLTLAALGLVHLPSRLVEVVIAASIAIAAADILWPVFRGRIWIVVFGFGLFHGFGFAGALEHTGVMREHLGLSLFAFNLGVEIGQLVIVVILFPFLFALRGLSVYRGVLLPVAACAMILMSLAWVGQRAFDFDLPTARGIVAAMRGALS
jgi:hypothetical protein